MLLHIDERMLIICILVTQVHAPGEEFIACTDDDISLDEVLACTMES